MTSRHILQILLWFAVQNQVCIAKRVIVDEIIERDERCITLDKLIPLANYLGVTVDFLLTDYIVTDEDNNLNILTQLFRGKTVEEKELAVNMLKLLFSYTDGKI